MNAGGAARPVFLAGPDDVDGALDALWQLLADAVPPDQVRWHDGLAFQAGLFDADDKLAHERHANVGALPAPPEQRRDHQRALRTRQAPRKLDAAVVALMRHVLLHDDPQRFVLVHRLAARVWADARHWQDRLHVERLLLERMAREVRREIHKMHAFVRFRPVSADDQGPTRHVAWFEPAHHVVRAAAGFFQQRFASMHWAILTPRGSVAWDRQTLQHGPPARRDDAPAADAGEALWLAYYRSIFNPARLKPAMMRREMPVRFWRNLPEAVAIAPLLRDARQRTGAMVEHAADTQRKLPRPMAQVDAPTSNRAPTQTQAQPPNQASVAATATPRSRWRALAARAAACTACPQQGRAIDTVFGRGAVPADVMLVGEQPGDQEDLAGRPFVGPAGAVAAAGRGRLGLAAGPCVRDQRGQALSPPASRQTAAAQDARSTGDCSVPGLAGSRNRMCEPESHRGFGCHGRTGLVGRCSTTAHQRRPCAPARRSRRACGRAPRQPAARWPST